MIIYKRQKLLLDLLSAAGGTLGATDFQKLLFLYLKKYEANQPSFEFVPYQFGSFSFQSYADRGSLQRKGLLHEAGDSAWKLTSKAEPYLDRQRRMIFKHFLTHTVPERGNSLVRRAYLAYPWFATRSEILERTLNKPEDQRAVRSLIPDRTITALFTIGYEGDSIDGYLGRLLKNGVNLVCDVRRNPLSRKTGFSKKQLKSFCEKVGIEYRHLPDLGIPSHRRRDLNSPADYQALFAEYEKEDLPQAGNAIRELGSLLKGHHRIALTCFEADHLSCHRHCVASEMVKLLSGCPQPLHI